MKKSFSKVADQVRALGFVQPNTGEPRRNPYTGKTHTLEPLAVMLYDFITTRTLVCGKDYTRRLWDNARYLFCETWPNEYFDLLD